MANSQNITNAATQAAEYSAAAIAPLGAEAFGQMLLWLVAVVGFILACAWLLRRVNAPGLAGSGVIRVLTAVSFGSRDRIALVQVGDKQLLLGISPGRINTLYVFDEPVIDSSNPQGPRYGAGSAGRGDFANKLQGFINRGRSPDA